MTPAFTLSLAGSPRHRTTAPTRCSATAWSDPMPVAVSSSTTTGRRFTGELFGDWWTCACALVCACVLVFMVHGVCDCVCVCGWFAYGRACARACGLPFILCVSETRARVRFGDTHWSGYSTAEHWADTNHPSIDPGVNSMLKQMVDVRADQGYSVWKAETFVVNGQQSGSERREQQQQRQQHANVTSAFDSSDGSGDGDGDGDGRGGGDGGGTITNAGGPAWLGEGGVMFQQLNPKFWSAIDDVIVYVNSRGLLVSHAFAGIGRGFTQASFEKPITALAR